MSLGQLYEKINEYNIKFFGDYLTKNQKTFQLTQSQLELIIDGLKNIKVDEPNEKVVKKVEEKVVKKAKKDKVWANVKSEDAAKTFNITVDEIKSFVTIEKSIKLNDVYKANKLRQTSSDSSKDRSKDCSFSSPCSPISGIKKCLCDDSKLN